MAIPVELRENVYELALLEDRIIEVNRQGPGSPALLIVSKQVRKEAISKYYSKNRFIINFTDYNPDPVMPFIKRYHEYFKSPKKYDPEKAKVGVLRIRAKGRPSWVNLWLWCWLYYHGEIDYFDTVCDGAMSNTASLKVIFYMLRAMKQRGTSWESAELGLHSHLIVLIFGDHRWTSDPHTEQRMAAARRRD